VRCVYTKRAKKSPSLARLLAHVEARVLSERIRRQQPRNAHPDVQVSSKPVGNCGGIFELVQIAAMAEAYNVRASVRHCASSLCTAASVQVVTASAM